MREAVIVSTARTPIGKAYRGAFNNTPSQQLAGHAIRHAVARAGVDGGEIDDVVFGAALQQGYQGGNIARQAALAGGLPVSVSGMSLDRQCASGMMAIATAAKQVVHDHMPVCIGGGVESISMVQTPEMRVAADPKLVAEHPHIYMSMLETAEVVADRYGISRDAMDAYALQSQQRTAAAQEAGKFDDEIVPLTSTMVMVDRETKEKSEHEVTLDKDEGNRPFDHSGRPAGTETRSRAGQDDHRRQRLAAFRRGIGIGRRWKPGTPRSAASSRSVPIAAWPSPGWSRTKWASDRSSPCRSC